MIAINTIVTIGFENADLKSCFIISAILPKSFLPTLSSLHHILKVKEKFKAHLKIKY